MKIILSPAKLMRPYFSPPSGKLLFKKQAQQLMSELKRWSVTDLMRQMKLSEEKGNETFHMIQQWGAKKNQINSAPALFAYIGEAFKAQDADHLKEEEVAYLNKHLFILSGLYGLLRANDLIEPYRLEMAQRGVAPEEQSLYHFWRADVEKNMLKQLTKGESLLNLASSEYSDLLQAPKLRSIMYTPHFYEKKNGELKSVSVFSKQARGTMARWCAVYNIVQPLDIKSFDELGYQFSSENSDGNELVFIR